MRTFNVHGPYFVKQDKGLYSVPETGDSELVADKYGCYIFATKWGNSFTPWYVGKTTRRFRDELFAPHKQALLDVLRENRKGKLYVFLLAPAPGRGLKNARATDEMEWYLVGACVKANAQLLNQRKRGDRKWEIAGVTTSERGRRTQGIAALRSFLVQ